jgi:hypothetical protein
MKTKFISGGIYYIPIFDKFGTYDGNTSTIYNSRIGGL